MQIFLDHVVDLLYIIFAVATLVVFVKRGFIDSVFRFGRTIMAGIAAYFIGPHVSRYLYDTFVYQSIYDWVYDKVEGFLEGAAGAVNIQGLIDELPFFVRQLVDRESIEAKYGGTVESFEEISSDFAASAARPLASLLSNLVAYVVVFLVAMVVLFLVFKLLDLIFKLPILNAINKVLGFVFGVFAAVLLMAAFTYVLGVLVGILGSTSSLKYLIEVSWLFRFFNDLSIFNLF